MICLELCFLYLIIKAEKTLEETANILRKFQGELENFLQEFENKHNSWNASTVVSEIIIIRSREPTLY